MNVRRNMVVLPFLLFLQIAITADVKMAKWSEGDPQWIVEERPDATNVKNSHWTVKNAYQWSKDKLNALLVGMIILENDVAKCEIAKIESCEGEAVANNIKGKLIFFYEWNLTLNWKGHLIGTTKEIEGTINISNFSDENIVAEIKINISLKELSYEAKIVKHFLYNQGRKKIRDQLEKYIKDLKEEFSKGMILPKKDVESSSKPKTFKNLHNSENMAKWSEGDPRWIVEERPDATNVKNSHWTVKNAYQWSKDKLNALLVGMIILENDVAKCEIAKIESCEGEAVANNIKGKLIFFYEWNLTLNWKGHLIGTTKEIEGTINISNFSDENIVAEIKINISLKELSYEAKIVKHFLYNQGRKKIRDQLEKYIKDLKEEFSKGMILPKKDVESSSKPKTFKNLHNSENMAKWSEGDPRWIVEERPDATNVKNSHW